MNKKYKTIILIAFLLIVLINTISNGAFTDVSITGQTNANLTPVKDVIGMVIDFIAIVGSGISIIILIVLGIKYMTGSIEEKATYKQTLLPYLIGAVFIFGGTLVPSIIYNMFK